MAELDEKRETFAHEYLRNLAAQMPKGKAAAAAAKAAGYKGSSLADNARRLPRHPLIKARMAEILVPKHAGEEQKTFATIETVKAKLSEIIAVKLGPAAVKVDHQISSSKLLAELEGWEAPKKIQGDLNITRIERIIVDPADKDRESI